MSEPNRVNRRNFLGRSLVAAGAAGMMAGAAGAEPADSPPATPGTPPDPSAMPLGTIGKLKISRLLLGGNLIGGWMHSRDLHYVDELFRAYATEEKILETLHLAAQYGVNTVFETGANFVERYNREYGGHMQFIPHIQVETGKTESQLADHIKAQVDTGAAALYVWGVSADQLVKVGAVDRLKLAVELAKKHDLPVGVGGHSLLVPMACEQAGVPCDFYVKTLHNDDYPSATPKELRKEFIWMDGGPGWYDNMWCINPQETIEFMRTVEKPWLAFKVLAAGAYYPRQGFTFAFENGADFIAVGMFDFQVKENCELVPRVVRRAQDRVRPWRA